MVSFVCDSCQTTMKKAKVAQHNYSCGSNSYSCVDCGNSFDPESIKPHNTCISEAEKHQGSMYKGPRASQQNPRPAPGVSQPQGKPRKHYLDSSSDEEEEKPAPTKKAKVETPAPTPAPTPAKTEKAKPAATPSFDVASEVKSLITKKGSISLKKLRKSILKSSGSEEKDAITKQILEALLDNSSNVKITWAESDD